MNTLRVNASRESTYITLLCNKSPQKQSSVCFANSRGLYEQIQKSRKVITTDKQISTYSLHSLYEVAMYLKS